MCECVRWETLFISSRPIWSAKHFDWLVPTNFLFFPDYLFVFCLLVVTAAKLQISWKFTGLEKLQRWDARWLSGTSFPVGVVGGKRGERTKDFLGDFRPHHCRHYIRPGFIIIAYTFSWSLIFIYFSSFPCVCLAMSKKKEKLSAQLEMTGNSFPILIWISTFFCG